MASVKAKNTTPELRVRRLLHSMGYRYRVHKRNLPGKPDVVFQARKKVIFVNGCFWHRHNCRLGNRVPKSNVDYWKSKFEANVARDKENLRSLIAAGWSVLIVWECETKLIEKLEKRLASFLGDRNVSTVKE